MGKKNNKDSPFIKSDGAIVLATLLIAILSGIIFPILCKSYFYGTNNEWTQAIPTVVGIFMFLLPFAIYYGIKIKDAEELSTNIFFKTLSHRLTDKTIIRYDAYYIPTTNGTYWEIYNLSPHDWEKAVVVIERLHDGELESERHELSYSARGKVIKLHSNLTSALATKWRLMVVTEFGSRIDYPSIWRKQFEKIEL